jgi:hypothetical protein
LRLSTAAGKTAILAQKRLAAAAANTLIWEACRFNLADVEALLPQIQIDGQNPASAAWTQCFLCCGCINPLREALRNSVCRARTMGV